MTNAVNLASAAGTGFSMRNRIINGDMRIDQRNAGASGTASGYTVDRFSISLSQASKLTWGQNYGSVTPPTGFTKYFGLQVGSAANVTVAAGDYFGFQHRIEGYNLADMGFGTANASSFTISFWVYSSLTGTFGFALQNGAQNRAYATTYTINAANTWEKKTITIAGDTSGTWATDNSTGLICTWGLGIGSTYAIAAGSSWTTTTSPNGFGVTGTVQLIQTNNATFYITGVQLEAGSVATPFERRPYGLELALCQRYYQTYSAFNYGTNASYIGYYGGSNALYPIQLGVPMRTVPTATISQPTQVQYYSQGNAWTNTTLSAFTYNNTYVTVVCPCDSTGGSKLLYLAGGATTTLPTINASAEL